MPLIRDQTIGDFDVVIDDAPASPNQKEVVWATFHQRAPDHQGHDHAAGPHRDPAILAVPGLVRGQDARSALPGRDSPEQAQQKQIAMQTAIAKIQDLAAGANLKNAKAGREQALTDHDHIDGFAKVAAMAAPPAVDPQAGVAA